MKPITLTKPNLLLVDDDKDDCIFFKEALESLPVSASLITVNNSEQLMQLLSEKIVKPAPNSLLFLDLNMPKKNGFEILSELKLDNHLKNLPVIIFSTYFEEDEVNLLYKNGAQYYIRKPTEFSQLKKVIYQALLLATGDNMVQPPKEHFVIKGDMETVQL